MDKHLESEAISQTSKSDLRRKAEKIASENELRPFESLPLNEVQQILHELRVHQIELEIQNEELRRTQMELDVQRVRYCDLYDLAPIGYCTVNEKGAIVQANLTAVILLETTRDKLVNALFSTFILTEDQDIYYLFHRGMMEGINQEACILRMVKKGGTPFWAHVTATVIQNDKGISELRIVFYDITKHKEAEIALHEATRKYQLLADYAKECIFLKDTDGNYSYFSPASEEIFGYKPEEFVANASLMSQIIYPDDRDAYQYHLDHLDENDINELEFRIVRSDGCERWIAHYCNTVRDENGRYFGRRGTNRDITEKKLMELALVESEAKLHNVTSSAQDAVIMIDNDGTVLSHPKFSN